MRRVSIAAVLLLAACATEVVELFPQDAAEPQADATTNPSPDAIVPDLGFAPDAEAPDLGFAMDAETPDAPSACVCRFLCRGDAECVRAIGPGSTCMLGLCVGSTGQCTTDSECDTGFLCAAGPTSTDRCN